MNSFDAQAIGDNEPIETLDNPSSEIVEQNALSVARIEALYREHGPRLLRGLARSVGRDEASDLMQEAFAKLLAMLPRSRKIERPEAFVTTVAKNVLRDRARSAVRQALSRQGCDARDSGPEGDPHQIMESREVLQAIERALSAMNPRRRQIFMLHRFEKLTYAEVGNLVGMSEKGVKKQIAKALVELRTAVERGA